MDPWFGAGFTYADSNIEVKSGGVKNEDDDADTAGSIDAGVQVDLGNDFSIGPSVGVSDVFDEADVSVTLAANKWLNKFLAAQPSVSYGFEDGDITVALILNAGF